MKKWIQEIRNFFFSQGFADGVRTTGAVLLPALILSYLGRFDAGLSISLGALCVSITDAPGPLQHKRNAMLACTGIIFLSALITGLIYGNVILSGLEILILSFVFSMFNVYGIRVASIGSAALLVIILTMDKPLTSLQAFTNSLLVLGGGIWYTLISLLSWQLLPYRSAQRALGECIQEIAKFLSIKAQFYQTGTDLEENYRKLLTQQVVVNEKQEAVRELLFKSRLIVREATQTGRKLVITFVHTVDLFEDITAIYYDYASLQKRYGNTGVLNDIAGIINSLAGELEAIGISIQTNITYTPHYPIEAELKNLQEKINQLNQTGKEDNPLILKKILVNVRTIARRINDLLIYFDSAIPRNSKNMRLHYERFVVHQKIDFQILQDNLTFRSAVFRHSLRVTIACIAGFCIAKLLAQGHHSYWILLTVAFILKPAFSLSKKRNGERLLGTLTGGAIGVLLLIFIANKTILFIFLLLFMLCAYSFQRTQYFVMVFCITPLILILFSFLGNGFLEVASERVSDTIIGCVLAFAASYFLFPNWEREQLQTHLSNVLKANIHYLNKLAVALTGKAVDELSYKLARKEVYVSSANLSAAFERMLSEPKSKQTNSKEVYQFVVLNHLLFSYVATLFKSVVKKEIRSCSAPVLRKTAQSIQTLCAALQKLNEECEPGIKVLVNQTNEKPMPPVEDVLLKEQADYLYQLSQNIKKKTEAIILI